MLISKNVEELWVARVRVKEERLPVLAPAVEVCLGFFTRRQVALPAVEFSQIEVLVLVPAFVIAIGETRVGRE